MNRRNFLKFLGIASAGATVAYSFPSIIVPKNIELINDINLISRTEIYPKLIEDFWFNESPLIAYFRTEETFEEIESKSENLITVCHKIAKEDKIRFREFISGV